MARVNRPTIWTNVLPVSSQSEVTISRWWVMEISSVLLLLGFIAACFFAALTGAVFRQAAGSGAQTTLFCPLKSRAHLPIGNPIAFFSNWKVLLAPPANRLSRWSNAVADDFVNRLASRAEIEKVVHCP